MIEANHQIAAFLNQAPFDGGNSVLGTFTFTSSLTVAAVALRGFTNERGEFLLTTLPIVEVGAMASTDPQAAEKIDGDGISKSDTIVSAKHPDRDIFDAGRSDEGARKTIEGIGARRECEFGIIPGIALKGKFVRRVVTDDKQGAARYRNEEGGRDAAFEAFEARGEFDAAGNDDGPRAAKLLQVREDGREVKLHGALWCEGF